MRSPPTTLSTTTIAEKHNGKSSCCVPACFCKLSASDDPYRKGSTAAALLHHHFTRTPRMMLSSLLSTDMMRYVYSITAFSYALPSLCFVDPCVSSTTPMSYFVLCFETTSKRLLSLSLSDLETTSLSLSLLEPPNDFRALISWK